MSVLGWMAVPMRMVMMVVGAVGVVMLMSVLVSMVMLASRFSAGFSEGNIIIVAAAAVITHSLPFQRWFNICLACKDTGQQWRSNVHSAHSTRRALTRSSRPCKTSEKKLWQ